MKITAAVMGKAEILVSRGHSTAPPVTDLVSRGHSTAPPITVLVS